MCMPRLSLAIFVVLFLCNLNCKLITLGCRAAKHWLRPKTRSIAVQLWCAMARDLARSIFYFFYPFAAIRSSVCMQWSIYHDRLLLTIDSILTYWHKTSSCTDAGWELWFLTWLMCDGMLYLFICSSNTLHICTMEWRNRVNWRQKKKRLPIALQ